MATPETVDAYLAGLSAERRARLESIRETIRAAAPAAVETIAYGMPALRTTGGRFLVSYAAYKRHDSLFPASGAVMAALGDELTPYLAAKSTIQFGLGAPIPLDLVRKVGEVRVAETASGSPDGDPPASD
jgi:uncharacterized protein YdhG (YjbR/CyaY superfamily)